MGRGGRAGLRRPGRWCRRRFLGAAAAGARSGAQRTWSRSARRPSGLPAAVPPAADTAACSGNHRGSLLFPPAASGAASWGTQAGTPGFPEGDGVGLESRGSPPPVPPLSWGAKENRYVVREIIVGQCSFLVGLGFSSCVPAARRGTVG